MEVNIIAVRSMFNRYRWDFFEKNKDKFFERRNHAMRNRFYINDDCTLFFNITEDKQFLILIHYKDKKYKYNAKIVRNEMKYGNCYTKKSNGRSRGTYIGVSLYITCSRYL